MQIAPNVTSDIKTPSRVVHVLGGRPRPRPRSRVLSSVMSLLSTVTDPGQ